jgi:hypothetical protein
MMIMIMISPTRAAPSRGRSNDVPASTAGNIRYRDLVETCRPAYELSTSKRDKSYIVGEVVRSIHKTGGRFLKQDADGGPWRPIDAKEACVKVSQSFRNQRRLVENRAGSNPFRADPELQQKGDGGGKGTAVSHKKFDPAGDTL